MIIERSYRLGSTGPEVAEIRVRLTALGLLDDTTDGFQDPGTAVFDEAVDRAVRAFQQRRGIISDGVVGPLTFRVLGGQVAPGRPDPALLPQPPAHRR